MIHQEGKNIRTVHSVTGGVSGVSIFRHSLEVKQGRTRNLLIKGTDYNQEVAAVKLLRPHIPVLDPIKVFEKDSTFTGYPDLSLDGSIDLDRYITTSNEINLNSRIYLDYLDMMNVLWQKTHEFSINHRKVTGYSEKIKDIDSLIAKSRIKSYSHLCSLYNAVAVVQNSPNITGISLTHGDENWGNVIVRGLYNRDISTRLIMIDCIGAGYRSPYEGITKLLGWPLIRFASSKSQGDSEAVSKWKNIFNLVIDSALNHKFLTSLSGSKSTHIDQLSSHLSIYLLRENVLWSKLRGDIKYKNEVHSILLNHLQSSLFSQHLI